METLYKWSGSSATSAAEARRVAQAIRESRMTEGRGSAAKYPFAIVHGGQKVIDRFELQRGRETRKVDGVRFTDEETLNAVIAGLGLVRVTTVHALVSEGIPAHGITGVDGGFIRAQVRENGKYGAVGIIKYVDPDVLRSYFRRRIAPVISPLAYGDGDYPIQNINADDVTERVAIAMGASSVVFLSNVPGVLDGERVIPEIDRHAAEQLVESRIIRDGMIPKIRAALSAIASGVGSVIITDMEGLVARSGTVVTA